MSSYLETRRTFLSSAGLLLAGCAAGVRAGRPDRVRFGVRSPFTTKDLGERAELLKRLGYDGIELGPEFLSVTAESIRERLASAGIAVGAIVGSIQLLAPDPEKRRAGIELTRTRLGMAQALGAAGVIEVPTFGECRFPEVAKEPPPHASRTVCSRRHWRSSRRTPRGRGCRSFWSR